VDQALVASGSGGSGLFLGVGDEERA